MANRLEGKIAVITGAGSGLGRAGAILFAREGASVIAVDVDEPGVRQTVQAITGKGGAAMALRVDVTKAADVQRMIDTGVQRHGRVDILWNNAGVMPRPPFGNIEDFPEEEWERVIGVNLKGVWLGCRAAAPLMKKQRNGAIINTASISGLVGWPAGLSIYCASKGGVVNLTRALATELAPYNVRVNAIAPGGMNTPMVRDISPARAPDPKLTDANRMAEPEEVAQTALYLAQDGVGPLTGSIVVHDGGITAQ